MATDAPVLVKGTGTLTDPDLPTSFVLAASAVETNQNDHQYDIGVGEGATLTLVLNVSANTGAISLQLTVQGVDPLGVVYPLLVSAVVAALGVVVLRIGPSIAAAANLSANVAVPDRVRILTTHGNTNSVTYSITGLISAA